MRCHNRSIRQSRPNGFSLIELLVVIAIVGILLGVGISGYSGWVARTNTEEIALTLQRSLALARSEAIRSGENVRLCGTQNGTSCSNSLTRGWLVFTDTDDSGQVNGAERILSLFDIASGNLSIEVANSIDATAVSSVSYSYRGYSNIPLNATIALGSHEHTFTMNRAGHIE